MPAPRSTGKPRTARTQIWAEGRQHAPLSPRAFARASLTLGREAMAALLDRCAVSARAFGTRVAAGKGRIPAERLGRSGRFLPDHRTVARAILGTAGLLARSARIILPDEAPAAPASIFDPAPRGAPPQAAPAAEAPPPRPARPPILSLVPAVPPRAEAEDPALAAIRQMMRAPVPPRPAHPPRAVAQLPPEASATETAPAAPRPGRLQPLLTEASARILGYGLLMLSLPWGALRAAIAHLSGQDLRKLDE